MGTLVGHVAPGVGFLLIGLWHLFNHIKLHLHQPNSYIAPPWFPNSKFKYLELWFIMAGSSAFIIMELFIGPAKHQPLDYDGTIPTYHLHNFEHSSISMTFLVYAAFAIILDKTSPEVKKELTQFLAALAFGQQLFLFHLHSADHTGPEGQYHMILQLIVTVSLTTTLMGIGLPKSFLVCFVRSLSIFSQGLWFMVMGFMLWTPGLMPKGCFMNSEEGHKVVRCHGDEALYRAKSLVNLQFSCFLVGVAIFGVSLYLVMVKIYGEKVEYFSLTRETEESEEDVESQNKFKIGNLKSFVNHMEQKAGFAPIDKLSR